MEGRRVPGLLLVMNQRRAIKNEVGVEKKVNTKLKNGSVGTDLRFAWLE